MKPTTRVDLGGFQKTNSDFRPGLVSPTLNYIKESENWLVENYAQYHGRPQGRIKKKVAF
jgi:hypothetical protein